MDIDGVLDVAVGAPGTDCPNEDCPGLLGDDWGAAYVLSGAGVMGMGADPFLETLPLDMDEEGDKGSRFGAHVAGDPGFPEEAICPKLAVAAPLFSMGDAATPCDCGDEERQNLNGKVYVYLGKTPLLTASYVGERNRDRLGKGLAWIGNAGDTEFNDLMLSGFAWTCGMAPSEAGRTYITLY